MNNNFYVYCYYRPWNSSPFYIGKGKNSRWKHHLKVGTKHKNKHIANIFKKSERLNLKVEAKILFSNMSESEAFELECQLINTHKRSTDGGLLANLTLGGEGASGNSMSDEQKKKLSELARNRIWTDEARDKLRKANLGIKRPPEVSEKTAAALRGRKRPQEVVKVIAEKLRGKKHSIERIEKNRVGHLGQKTSEETRAKLSVIRTGRKLSEETIKKIKVSNLGQKRSEEACRNISAAQKLRISKFNHWTGSKHSETSKEKMSGAQCNRFARDGVSSETNEKRRKKMLKFYEDHPEAKIKLSRNMKEIQLRKKQQQQELYNVH